MTSGTSLSRVEETEGKLDGDQWVVGVPDTTEAGKSKEVMSFLEHNEPEVTHINNDKIKKINDLKEFS